MARYLSSLSSTIKSSKWPHTLLLNCEIIRGNKIWEIMKRERQGNIQTEKQRKGDRTRTRHVETKPNEKTRRLFIRYKITENPSNAIQTPYLIRQKHQWHKKNFSSLSINHIHTNVCRYINTTSSSSVSIPISQRFSIDLSLVIFSSYCFLCAKHVDARFYFGAVNGSID